MAANSAVMFFQIYQELKRFHLLMLLLLTLLFSVPLMAQKLAKDGYTVSVKKFEQGETSMVCGPKKTAYGGLFQVKSKDELKGSYYLTLMYMNEKEYIMTVKNSKQSLVNPMLVYNTEKGSFQYSVNKVLMNEAKADTSKPMQERMMQGLLLWLEVRKKLNGKK